MGKKSKKFPVGTGTLLEKKGKPGEQLKLPPSEQKNPGALKNLARPHPQLLLLIASFLTQYQFPNSAERFLVERRAHVRQAGWEDEGVNGKLDQSLPPLPKLFDEWYKQRSGTTNSVTTNATRGNATAQGDAASSTSSDESQDSSSVDSDTDDDVETFRKCALPSKSKSGKTDTTGHAVSSSSSSSDESVRDLGKIGRPAFSSVAPAKSGNVKGKKAKHTSSESTSASESPSESDSSTTSLEKDLENRGKTRNDRQNLLGLPSGRSSSGDSSANSYESSETSNSSSSDSSDSDSDASPQRVKAKANIKAASEDSSRSSATLVAEDSRKSVASRQRPMDSSTSSSTSSHGSDSSSASVASVVDKKKASLTNTKRQRSPSPATIATARGSKRARPNVEQAPPPPAPGQGVRNAKPQNKPFSRVPSNLPVDEKFASNAYVPYDYAERAHRDLVVTKGKGFTKEKNKKKRGSYRGGTIDVNGKKGIKFE